MSLGTLKKKKIIKKRFCIISAQMRKAIVLSHACKSGSYSLPLSCLACSLGIEIYFTVKISIIYIIPKFHLNNQSQVRDKVLKRDGLGFGYKTSQTRQFHVTRLRVTNSVTIRCIRAHLKVSQE